MIKALFLDRDGIVNEDVGYLYRPEDTVFTDGIHELMKSAREKGYMLIVITNQSGIARGLYTPEDVEKLHEWMNTKLEKHDLRIDDFFFCPHHPEHSGPCTCRKPAPGLIDRAVDKYGIDRKASVMIGDKKSDIGAAVNAGLGGSILVSGRYASECGDADHTAGNIREALRIFEEYF